MSEKLSECVVHPVEEDGFKRSVLRTVLVRRLLATSGIGQQELGPEVNETFLSALGVDRERSLQVNDCASRIIAGECTEYELSANGRAVEITKKGERNE